MNQDDINQHEWKNPQNWSFIVYHSQRDGRMLVPKRLGFGWTINLQSKTGARIFLTLLLLIPLVSLLAALIIRNHLAGR